MLCKKIGVFIEDEWVAVSFNTIISALKEAGLVPVVITTNREWGDGMKKSFPYDNEPAQYLKADLSVNEVIISDYAGFVFGGGYWVDRLRWWFKKKGQNGKLEIPEPIALVSSILESDKHKVGVICHSMWLLCSLKDKVKAKNVTCAYNIIDDVTNAGFNYVDTDVHIDGNLITGRMSANSDVFIKEYINQLKK
ncbi:MAG: DJ-1/PfpI family protein [Nitrospirae bacterium YQR-1]